MFYPIGGTPSSYCKEFPTYHISVPAEDNTWYKHMPEKFVFDLIE